MEPTAQTVLDSIFSGLGLGEILQFIINAGVLVIGVRMAVKGVLWAKKMIGIAEADFANARQREQDNAASYDQWRQELQEMKSEAADLPEVFYDYATGEYKTGEELYGSDGSDGYDGPDDTVNSSDVDPRDAGYRIISEDGNFVYYTDPDTGEFASWYKHG